MKKILNAIQFCRFVFLLAQAWNREGTHILSLSKFGVDAHTVVTANGRDAWRLAKLADEHFTMTDVPLKPTRFGGWRAL